MNLYTNKSRWKWLLFSSATIIFILLMLYSNSLIKKIAEREKKGQCMGDAIVYKAELVNHTDLFEQIRREEETSFFFSTSNTKVSEAGLNEDITFIWIIYPQIQLYPHFLSIRMEQLIVL